MKVEESLNMTFDESPPPTKLSSLVDDDVGEEEAIENNIKVVNNNNIKDKSIEVDEFEMSMMGELNFTYHERIMNPLDISRKTIKDKGKRADPPSSYSSSSSYDENETSSFLEFYEELSDNEELTDEQKEKRGMFKCLNCYFDTITNEEHQNERTSSPYPRKKSLSPPNAPSKSTSSRSTYQTSSSSPSELPTPTHVAPQPKLRFIILMKLEPQELPSQILSPHDPYVSTVDN
ncbi:hypothetical protein Tco_1197869 [Tanacetum coccineum]